MAQKLKNADRELVLTRVLTEAFEQRFNALRDEMHAHVAANIAAAHPRFVELYNDPTSKPWIACQYLDSAFLPDDRKAFRPHFGKQVEEPRCASWYSRVDNATGINLSQKQYLPAPQSYTAKITDKALQDKYDKAWNDYTAAYDKISAVLNSYTTLDWAVLNSYTALDWAVADVLGYAKVTDSSGLDGPVIMHKTTATQECNGRVRSDWRVFTPSTDWSQGGPIIERECIDVLTASDPSKGWFAQLGIGSKTKGLHKQYGPTPLIAAMRCFVASKLGDEVDVPEELL